MPGGNLIWANSRFLDTDAAGKTPRFSGPPVSGFILDFGVGSPATTTAAGLSTTPYTGTGRILGCFTASLIDPGGRWRGWWRFEVRAAPMRLG
jgi:hypothetical protein